MHPETLRELAWAVNVPGTRTVFALSVAVLAVSSSAPLIAYLTIPALAIAFWRNALATAVLIPVTMITGRAELRAAFTGPGCRNGVYCVLAGLALAAHFGTWMPSVQLSSVATAAALVATQPVWQGLIALAQGRRLPRLAWAGIVAAVAGAALATGADFAVSGTAFLGDLLAVAGGMFAAVYTALGEQARTAISTTTYTTVCYGVCAVALAAACLLAGAPLGDYDRRSWIAILALTAGAQLLGHSLFNYALHRVSATTVSVLILLEVPAAAAIAWAWLRQVPPPAALPGLVLVLLGVGAVILGAARAAPSAEPPTAPDLVPPAGPATS